MKKREKRETEKRRGKEKDMKEGGEGRGGRRGMERESEEVKVKVRKRYIIYILSSPFPQLFLCVRYYMTEKVWEYPFIKY